MISRICLTLAVISITWLVMLGETATSQGPATARHVDSAVKAKSPHEAAEAYDLLFSQAPAKKLQDLLNDKHLNISLRAAWERVRRTVEEEEDELSDPVSPDASELQRFVGFVEGRLAVPIPERWEHALLSAMAHQRDNIFFPVFDNSPYRGTEGVLLAPKSVSVQENDGGFLLGVDAHSFRIPADIIKRAKGHVNSVNAIVDGDRCYVALHADRCSPYQIHCFEFRTAKLIWSADVWAAGDFAMYTGLGFHWADLMVRDQTLYVFGVGDDAVYVEALSAKDGNNKLRFTTSY